MDSIQDVKLALQARARTQTIDELQARGRRKVRMIRAEHIAQLIAESVQRAVQGSGLVGPDEVEQLIAASRAEFQSALQEREQELAAAQEARSAAERHQARAAELDEQLAGERERAEVFRQRVTELEAELATAQTALEETVAGAPAATGDGVPSEMVMQLMTEVAHLKADLARQGGAPAAAPAAAAGGGDITAAISQLTGALNERLDQFGRKMGISSAVDADQIDFSGLIDSQDRAAGSMESNVESVEVKKKSGGGIAANLERLKKLKGGG